MCVCVSVSLCMCVFVSVALPVTHMHIRQGYKKTERGQKLFPHTPFKKMYMCVCVVALFVVCMECYGVNQCRGGCL